MGFFSGISILITTIFTYLVAQFRIVYILYKTILRDIKGGHRYVRLNCYLWYLRKTKKTVPKLFRQYVLKHPDKIAFICDDEKWSYKQVDDLSSKIANYLKQEGFERGDTIALLLESKPEYVCVWLGASKIGVSTALINTNLVSAGLIHTIAAADCKGIIFGSNFSKEIENILPNFNHLQLYQFSDGAKTENLIENAVLLNDALIDVSEEFPLNDVEIGDPNEKVLYVYTSGTTGLPKAAIITHNRFFYMGIAMGIMGGIGKNDILYGPLPMYHASGTVLGVGQGILRGTTVVIKKKFSARSFWKNCQQHKCTVAQYIGETCRYILAAHDKTDKPNKSVKKITGNGLHPKIWNQFKKQFDIDEVVEFYGSTEGNSSLINVDNKSGAVGFVPIYANNIYPLSLIKCDEKTAQPLKDCNGFCIRCGNEEAGVLIGKITGESISKFTGYADKEATDQKIMKNVFKNGDSYFNTGDIFVRDEFGYFYFKDRTGDTFRWKGENVATTEVEGIINNITGLKGAIVYGVKVPGTEGRAGMAALVDPNKSLDLKKFAEQCKSNLPSYSVPMFVRIIETLPLTGTFKLKKNDLQQEGFNVKAIKDPIFFLDPKQKTYVEVTQKVFDSIVNGSVRL